MLEMVMVPNLENLKESGAESTNVAVCFKVSLSGTTASRHWPSHLSQVFLNLYKGFTKLLRRFCQGRLTANTGPSWLYDPFVARWFNTWATP
jgi:hypothetical protein